MCQNMNASDMCCKSELNLRKLCVDCIKAKCISVEGIRLCDLCAQTIEAKNLFAENEIVNNICASGKAQAAEIWADKSYANSLCAASANLGSACIDNLTVGSFNHCEKYRAAVTLSADISYVLGSNINWNVVLDDPNSNISLAPFSYTAPVSGYYLLSFYLNSDSLAGSSIITGIPVGLLTTTINGLELRQAQAPYLSFSLLQKGNLSSLVLLNAGDIVRMKYDVLVFDQVLGLVPYVGTVSLKGNGLLPGQSGFEIHYLSSLNCQSQVCPQCPMVSIPCLPFTVPCEPCNDSMGARQKNAEVSPCDSCQ